MPKIQELDLNKQIKDDNLRRYVLSVNSNQEEMVIENMKERIKKINLESDITDFFIPVVNEIITRKNKKTIKPKKLYPGYLLIRMKMNDKIRYIVRNTPGVRLIIGAETRPIPIEDEQYEQIVADVREKNAKLTTRNSFKIDDVVVIRETNFKNMKGRVAEVDDLRGQVTVMVEFMGRTTPVSLSFDKVELA
ncbi:MAG TPA: transcription termination/antitermination protein NusG [Candidatus Absconditabacterales bacterium]|nr:transcription termination/antitermination protein NusG [Candidatus Absconditabacterales bacterium]HNG96803.1 transcription termination/antitermination protein NusG [Candidatus Absconditabacterales bacterium]